MADDRNSYKNQAITLELHSSEVSVPVISVDSVRIIQDKEVCYETIIITTISGGWSIALNTDQIKYTGEYHDRWVLNGGSLEIEKTLIVTEVASTVPIKSSGNYTYYSKDLYFDIQSDGDLYRIYDNNSIAAKIEAVCMTILGSLYNEPGHGTNLYRYLFSSSSNVADEIRLDLETQLQMQVPQIKVSSITVVPTDYNAYTVIVNFFNIVSSNPSELLSMTNLVSTAQVI